MKDKFFSLVGFIFDSIKVLAAVGVIAFIAVLVIAISNTASRL